MSPERRGPQRSRSKTDVGGNASGGTARRRQLTQENLVVSEGKAHDGIQGAHDNATDIIRTKSRTDWRRVDPVNMNVRQAMCL
jgi:hypothetical protein